MTHPDHRPITRRQFLRGACGGVLAAGLGGTGVVLAARGSAHAGHTVWQIDPGKCIACGNCATYCVLTPSAVKCVHAFKLCGYCELCFGFFDPRVSTPEAGAENLLCPTDAVARRFVEGPYYEYTIDELRCVGCGKCVKGCTTFGNGSLMLQVRHDRCVNCNECAIAAACPTSAFRRVPATRPYLIKGVESAAAGGQPARTGPSGRAGGPCGPGPVCRRNEPPEDPHG